MIYDGREVIFIDYEYDQMASFNLSDGIVGVAISGGLDSTTLLYAICQYITDLKLNIEILPLHSADIHLPNTLIPVQKIVEDVMKRYPNVKFKDLEVNFYDGGEFKLINGKELDNGKMRGHKKKTSVNNFYKTIYKKYNNLNIIITAFTALPSYKIVNKWKCGISKARVEKQFHIHEYTENGIYLFNPFALCDKKLIANIFTYLNLPKKYLTETWSCTMYAEQTKNFTVPCGQCYHCWEKKWAFGQF